MLIIGARGFAKEVLQVLNETDPAATHVFYDDVNTEGSGLLFGRFPVLDHIEKARAYFATTDSRFTLGIGDPVLRKRLSDKFSAAGGVLSSTISASAAIGTFDVHIGGGSNILAGACLSNSVHLGTGCIVYYNAMITHDCVIGDFAELSPGATILGRVRIGDYTKVGANATVLPDLVIGRNVTIGAGAVVTRDVPDNSVVAGVPATVRNIKAPLDL